MLQDVEGSVAGLLTALTEALDPHCTSAVQGPQQVPSHAVAELRVPIAYCCVCRGCQQRAAVLLAVG